MILIANKKCHRFKICQLFDSTHIPTSIYLKTKIAEYTAVIEKAWVCLQTLFCYRWVAPAQIAQQKTETKFNSLQTYVRYK